MTALALSACVGVWTWQGDQTSRVGSFLALHALAFVAYLVALRASRGLGRAGLWACLALSFAWRVVLVAAPPLLSNDVNRSVWEGRIQLHGGNPYRWADRPEAEKWFPLRDEVWRGMNHRDYTAIYPPLWQLACRAVVAVDDSIVAMKAFLALCELGLLGLLALLLRRRRQPPERLLILAWSPLALVESAGGGHNEPLALLLTVAALLALESRRPLVSALAAALAFQAKLLPAFIALAWSRRYRLRHVLPALALAGVLVWPYASARAGLFRSLGAYGAYWRFNETLFAPLAATMGHVTAVRMAGIGLATLAGVLAWRRTEPVAAATAVVAATLAFSPNVLPWYGLWLLPLLVLRDEPAALVFTGTLPLAYLVYPRWLAGEAWHLGWGVRALEYVPVAIVALWARFDRIRSLAER